MARNRYAGTCYRCKKTVPPGEGHFERFAGGWRVQHASCAIEMRGTPDPAREARNERLLALKARGTGRSAQRARKRLRDAAAESFEDLTRGS